MERRATPQKWESLKVLKNLKIPEETDKENNESTTEKQEYSSSESRKPDVSVNNTSKVVKDE